MRARDYIADSARCLNANVEAAAIALLGEPTTRNKHELRFGRRSSLSIRIAGDRRGLWYSYESAKGGDMLTLARQVHGGVMPDALEWARRFLDGPKTQRSPKSAANSCAMVRDAPLRWSVRASLIWSAASPVLGTLAERYLRIRIGPAWENIRQTIDGAGALRFLPAHANYGPAMVALVTDTLTNEPLSLHFTRLQADGLGKANDGKPAKRLLGGHRKAGGVVRLSADEEITVGLGIAEGIETALAVIASGWSPVWACVDAGNMSNLPVLGGIETLTVFADYDAAGLCAANKVFKRWIDAGRKSQIVTPPISGRDWADCTAECGA